jgi:hypothetical protein
MHVGVGSRGRAAELDDMHAEMLFAKRKSRPSVLGDVAFSQYLLSIQSY